MVDYLLIVDMLTKCNLATSLYVTVLMVDMLDLGKINTVYIPF